MLVKGNKTTCTSKHCSPEVKENKSILTNAIAELRMNQPGPPATLALDHSNTFQIHLYSL